MLHLHRLIVAVTLCCAASPVIAADSVEPPNYDGCRLEAIFPAGGQRGTTVTVEFQGIQGGLAGARDILVDGDPGVTVKGVRNRSDNIAEADLEIAADARPGRRMLRVVCDRSGLTNFAYFVVGSLPEILEQEKNDEILKAQQVALPVVLNGRVNPEVDVDCYRFEAKAGQKIVAAALAHAFDSHGPMIGKNRGFVDATLELLDAGGRVLADAGDTLGFDPVVAFEVPADGTYFARVQLLGYRGFPQAVYRLTLGEVPLVTSVFPPGGQAGTSVDVEFRGFNVPPGTRQRLEVPADSDLPLTSISLDGQTAGNHDLPFVFGPHPEALETEPNGERGAANALGVPSTVNARFLEPGDEDWYRLSLKAGQAVSLEVIAQRHLRSPIDTRLEVFNADGEMLAANDDAAEHNGEQPHDFKTFDSQLTFAPKTDGEYFVRLSENTGAAGDRAVYRLTVSEAAPDFRMYAWPDGVPVWGPGTTSGFVVKVERFPVLPSDVEISIEGLPPGWTGSTTFSLGNRPDRPVTYHDLHVFLTITAPADAAVGTVVPFRVVGRATHDGRTLERTAQPLTFYHSGDRGFYRVSPTMRAVVAASRGASLETDVRELALAPGGTGTVRVRVRDAGDLTSFPTVVNLATNGVACSLVAPANLAIKDGWIDVPITATNLPPGRHGIVISRGWRSDIRAGMPGPCTSVISLSVTDPAAKSP